MLFKLKDIAEFNPRESIANGTIAKKVAMEHLTPFQRFISDYSLEPFQGGTKFRNGDTIMARITPCLENGKIAKVTILEPNEVGFGSTEYIVFRAKPDLVDEDYLYYLLCSNAVRDVAIKSMVGSSGRQRVQTNVLKELEIDLPSMAAQIKIGSILSSLDIKIELNNKICMNLQQQADEIYKHMFELNPSPTWSQGCLADLVVIKYGKDHKHLEDGNYPVFGSGGIMRWVDRPLYSKESVLIPRKGTLNNVIYINEPFWSVDTMFFTEMKQPNSAKFVYHFIKSLDLESMNSGSAVPSLTTKLLYSLKLKIPSNESLASFEQTVSPMYSAIQNFSKESLKLAAIRDALLPKLMSGKIKVVKHL